VLLQDGSVDTERTRELVELARPMGVTFHRAIDWAPRMEEALEQVIEAGADRILTSGGSPSALEGLRQITRLIQRAEGRIGVMVCGKVREDNIAEIARETRASEFHASLRKPRKSPAHRANRLVPLGEGAEDDLALYAVAAEDVRALRNALEALAPSP
jgi:copper homeostasis protein